MSCVFQNIDPPTPSPPGECVLTPQQRRGVHTRRAERGVGGSIFWKTQDIGLASYSYNLSTFTSFSFSNQYSHIFPPILLLNSFHVSFLPFSINVPKASIPIILTQSVASLYSQTAPSFLSFIFFLLHSSSSHLPLPCPPFFLPLSPFPSDLPSFLFLFLHSLPLSLNLSPSLCLYLFSSSFLPSPSSSFFDESLCCYDINGFCMQIPSFVSTITIIKSQSQDLQFFVAEFKHEFIHFPLDWSGCFLFCKYLHCFQRTFLRTIDGKNRETLKMLCGDRGTQNI